MAVDRLPMPMRPEDLVGYRWTMQVPPLNFIDMTGPSPAKRRQTLLVDMTSTPHVFGTSISGKTIARKVWGYGRAGKVTYPGPVIVAARSTPGVAPAEQRNVRLVFKNRLTADKTHGHFPFVQPTSDFAAGGMGADAMGRYSPGHAVVHLHGAELPWEFDGHPVRLPRGSRNPRRLPTVFRPGSTATYRYPNTQRGGGLIWFHDHVMDATGHDVYAGLAGGYILRAPGETRAIETGQLPGAGCEMALILQDRSFTTQGELLYGDAKFLAEYYRLTRPCRTRAALRQAVADALGASPANLQSPMGEFKGHALLVNGVMWPRAVVAPRVYRLRLLNGCNSRYFVLRLSHEDPAHNDSANDTVRRGDSGVDAAAASLFQIGSDSGIFPAMVELNGLGPANPANYLVLAPGERADVLVDFSKLAIGTSVFLTNHATGSKPLGMSGDDPGRFSAANTDELLQNVLRFDVVAAVASPCTGPTTLDPPVINGLLRAIVDDEDAVFGLPLGTITDRPGGENFAQRDLVLKEFDNVAFSAADAAFVKANNGNFPPGRQGWAAITVQSDPDRAQEPGYLWGGSMAGLVDAAQARWQPPFAGGPALDGDREIHLGAPHVEIWNIYNLTGDTHPIHIHLANFQVLDRRVLAVAQVPGQPDPQPIAVITPQTTPVEANENSGWKDTARAHPGEVTRLLVQFRGNGGSIDPLSNFVWHCHLLEHEDMGMMRPLQVIKS